MRIRNKEKRERQRKINKRRISIRRDGWMEKAEINHTFSLKLWKRRPSL